MTRQPHTQTALWALAAMAAITVWAIWRLNAHWQGLPQYEAWTRLAIWLGISCCVTGGLAARAVMQRDAWFKPLSLWFLAHAGCAFLVVMTMMGGGGTGPLPWAALIWMLTAVGWVPAFFWAFAGALLVVSLFPSKTRADDPFQLSRWGDPAFRNRDDDR